MRRSLRRTRNTWTEKKFLFNCGVMEELINRGTEVQGSPDGGRKGLLYPRPTPGPFTSSPEHCTPLSLRDDSRLFYALLVLFCVRIVVFVLPIVRLRFVYCCPLLTVNLVVVFFILVRLPNLGLKGEVICPQGL